MGSFHQAALEEGSEQAIDIAPVNMIDLMLILLIFFIVSTTFVQETGVEVDKPQSGGPQHPGSKSNITIALTGKGEVLYEGYDIGLSRIQQKVKQELQKEKLPVIIQADADAETGLLVRVIDEARRAGASEVNVATRPAAKK